MIKFQHAWGKLRCKTAQLRFVDDQSLIAFETFDPSFGFLINQFQTRGKIGGSFIRLPAAIAPDQARVTIRAKAIAAICVVSIFFCQLRHRKACERRFLAQMII
ncbi:hypothetical protein [Thalassospira alkalitolerans]|uniref:hypothetical protein n=1 Tax=Thalassospira alkalitolerans TaxID=1293890 RepID=UPI003AA9B0BF